tara:strand:- start:202 stop:405 length:204 start_codon:yes stop_codon:yes gene_type:complete
MGKISKGVDCSVSSCTNSAMRSMSSKNVDSSEFSISSDSNKVYFCTEHYKSWKKSTKELRKSERARY